VWLTVILSLGGFAGYQATVTAGIPFHGLPTQVPGTIEAEDFDYGGQGISYHIWPANETTSAYRSDPVPIQFGSVTLRPLEWLSYTISVPVDGLYTLSISASFYDNVSGHHTVHVEVDGLNVSGACEVFWYGYQQDPLPVDMLLTQGIHEFRLVYDPALENAIDVYSFSLKRIAAPPPALLHVAGGDTPGFQDGIGQAARFSDNLRGLGFDSQGNLLVADAGNLRLRKVSSQNEVSTVAGNGFKGWIDGQGTSASFNDIPLPRSLAVNSQGITFLLDRNRDIAKCRIRQIDREGNVSTRLEIPMHSSVNYGFLSIDERDRIYYLYSYYLGFEVYSYQLNQLGEGSGPVVVYETGGKGGLTDANATRSDSIYLAGYRYYSGNFEYEHFVESLRLGESPVTLLNYTTSIRMQNPIHSLTVSGADGAGIWIARAGMDLQRLLPDGSSTTIHRSPAIRLPIALSDDGRLAFVEGNQIWQFSSEPGILIRGFTTGGGTIVTDPLGPYLRNAVVQVTARPEPGWVFLGWKGDVDTEAAAVSVIADRHQTLNAAFGIPISSATMNGHVEIEPALDYYPYGTVVSLSAQPNSGYELLRWTDGVTSAIRQLVVTSSSPPVPIFGALPEYTVTAGALDGLGGTVEKRPGQPSYFRDTVVTLIARPHAGNRFVAWTDGTQDNPRDVVVRSNIVLNAAFGLGVVVPPAIVAGPSNLTVQAGSTVRLLVEATGGSPLEYHWYKDGVQIPGAMSSLLTLSSVEQADAGTYRVGVSNSAANTFDEATLVVEPLPAVAAPRLAMVPVSAGLFELSLEGEPGREYLIQDSTTLQSWRDLIRFLGSNAPFRIKVPFNFQPGATVFRGLVETNAIPLPRGLIPGHAVREVR